MLTKEQEMSQPDVFCEHTIQQNVTVARALPQTQLAEALSSSLLQEGSFATVRRRRVGDEQKGREGEG